MWMYQENIFSSVCFVTYHLLPEPSMLEMMVLEVIVDTYIYQSVIIWMIQFDFLPTPLLLLQDDIWRK